MVFNFLFSVIHLYEYHIIIQERARDKWLVEPVDWSGEHIDLEDIHDLYLIENYACVVNYETKVFTTVLIAQAEDFSRIILFDLVHFEVITFNLIVKDLFESCKAVFLKGLHAIVFSYNSQTMLCIIRKHNTNNIVFSVYILSLC